ncbi:hypothetical protein [Hyphomicrobium sp. ghe19]|uniref:hypothetical protein n=1 Tax=Hyphomicrobium sp. ghe19 TaxID=2682968 RepID=UPI0030D352D1
MIDCCISMEVCDSECRLGEEFRAEFVPLSDLAEEIPLIEAHHFNNRIDQFAGPVECQAAALVACDASHGNIKGRCGSPIKLQFS